MTRDEAISLGLTSLHQAQNDALGAAYDAGLAANPVQPVVQPQMPGESMPAVDVEAIKAEAAKEAVEAYKALIIEKLKVVRKDDDDLLTELQGVEQTPVVASPADQA